MSRLNILYMHSHDTGRCIEPYGCAVTTPNLRRLAERGVMFRQAYCAAPTCSPSRAGLLFGQAPHSVGMLGLSNLGWSIHDMSQHLHHHLRRHGYTTALCGTQHIARDPRDIGYDQLVPTQANGLIDSAVGWLRQTAEQQKQGDKPFFLSLGHGLTHRHRYLTPGEKDNPGYLPVPGPMPDHPVVRQDFAAFSASVRQLDEDWGRIMAALAETGLDGNTLVICTTDHGVGFPRCKCSLFDGGLSVMLLMSGPAGSEFTGGKVIDALASQIDLYPTICDLLGIESPPWLQGVSLMPLVRGERASVRDEIYGEITHHVSYQPERCVRTTRYKYIRRFSDRRLPVQPNVDDGLTKSLWQSLGWGGQHEPAEALYDVLFDPGEMRDLSHDPAHAEILRDLRGRLERWMRRTDDPLLHVPVPLRAGTGARFIAQNETSSDGPWQDVP
ncbi:MAG: sulfatase [Phycisphaeraceae bacterium]|nr:sulfatase [Phycisphaeraceae bacterium]